MARKVTFDVAVKNCRQSFENHKNILTRLDSATFELRTRKKLFKQEIILIEKKYGEETEVFHANLKGYLGSTDFENKLTEWEEKKFDRVVSLDRYSLNQANEDEINYVKSFEEQALKYMPNKIFGDYEIRVIPVWSKAVIMLDEDEEEDNQRRDFEEKSGVYARYVLVKDGKYYDIREQITKEIADLILKSDSIKLTEVRKDGLHFHNLELCLREVSGSYEYWKETYETSEYEISIVPLEDLNSKNNEVII